MGDLILCNHTKQFFLRNKHEINNNLHDIIVGEPRFGNKSRVDYSDTHRFTENFYEATIS